MKGNACSSLHIKCFLKRASLSLIRGDANSHGAALLSTSGFMTGNRCTQVDKKLLITNEVAPDKSKGPGYYISTTPHKGGETL